jgi:hypothetical protein
MPTTDRDREAGVLGKHDDFIYLLGLLLLSSWLVADGYVPLLEVEQWLVAVYPLRVTARTH